VDVQTVHAAAPEALAELPDPDAVFVGGGGADLPAVVTACARRARRTVVVTLAALDRVPAVRAALEAAGLHTDGVLLHSSRLTPLPPASTRLSPTNPTFVLWAHHAPPRAAAENHPPGARPSRRHPANSPRTSAAGQPHTYPADPTPGQQPRPSGQGGPRDPVAPAEPAGRTPDEKEVTP
jgi:hypothetical protein